MSALREIGATVVWTALLVALAIIVIAISRRIARCSHKQAGEQPSRPRDRSWTLPNGQPRPLVAKRPDPPPVRPADKVAGSSTMYVRLTVDAAASQERKALANLLRREWPFLDAAAILEIQTIVQASRDLRRAHADRG